jgi:hypothetical protein
MIKEGQGVEVIVDGIYFQIFLSINLAGLILYIIGTCGLFFFKCWPKLDTKAWVNIAIFLMSFFIKTIPWSLILISFDPILDKKLGRRFYAE